LASDPNFRNICTATKALLVPDGKGIFFVSFSERHVEILHHFNSCEQENCVQVTTLLPEMGTSWKHCSTTWAIFLYAKYHTMGGPFTAATELCLPLSFLSTL